MSLMASSESQISCWCPRYIRNLKCISESLPRFGTHCWGIGKIIGISEVSPRRSKMKLFWCQKPMFLTNFLYWKIMLIDRSWQFVLEIYPYHWYRRGPNSQNHHIRFRSSVDWIYHWTEVESQHGRESTVYSICFQLYWYRWEGPILSQTKEYAVDLESVRFESRSTEYSFAAGNDYRPRRKSACIFLQEVYEGF